VSNINITARNVREIENANYERTKKRANKCDVEGKKDNDKITHNGFFLRTMYTARKKRAINQDDGPAVAVIVLIGIITDR
jgi:hypothetical protein